MRRLLAAAFVVLGGMLLVALASTMALSMPSQRHLGTTVQSVLSADYSKDNLVISIKPLSPRIIDEARRDNQRLDQVEQSTGQIVRAFSRDGSGSSSSPPSSPGPAPSPSLVVQISPPAGASNTPTPGGSTPGGTPGSTPGGTPSVTPPRTPLASTPPPPPTPVPTPTPTPACNTPDPVDGFVRSIVPPDGTTGVPLTASFLVIFNQPMDARSVTGNVLFVTESTGRTIRMQVVYDPQSLVATMTPIDPLSPGAVYYLSVWKTVKNACAVQQGVTVTSTFTTAP